MNREIGSLTEKVFLLNALILLFPRLLVSSRASEFRAKFSALSLTTISLVFQSVAHLKLKENIKEYHQTSFLREVFLSFLFAIFPSNVGRLHKLCQTQREQTTYPLPHRLFSSSWKILQFIEQSKCFDRELLTFPKHERQSRWRNFSTNSPDKNKNIFARKHTLKHVPQYLSRSYCLPRKNWTLTSNGNSLCRYKQSCYWVEY